MKKYIDKLKNLKSTNKKLYIGIICMLLLVGVTFAFVAAQISGGAFKLFNLGAQTTDQLEFVVDKDLSLTATQFNFVEGGNNLSDTSIATAKLKANSTNKTASYNYNVYLVIEENEFKYTTSDKKTEILLQVTDPNGNSLTTLDGLTYNSTLQGFDITEEQGILAVAENFNISSNSSTNWTSQNWTFTITFINLDTNQKENAGKHMSGKIKIQQLTEVGNDITVAVNNLPAAYGPLATLNCKGSDSVYNQQYNRIEVANMSKSQSFCNITYNDRTEKQYLNDYIMGLEGTTQGDGMLVHETFNWPNFSDAYTLTENDYMNKTQYYNTNDYSKDGTNIDNAFSYVDGEWISNPDNMTLNNYYYLKFQVPSDGYYQICYTSNYDMYTNKYIDNYTDSALYVHDGYMDNGLSGENYCSRLTYMLSDKFYSIIQKYVSTGRQIKFKIQKTSKLDAYDTGYRYEGQDPNNYVWFNNELWRIIGVMNAKTHGQTGLNLVKIVRNDSIGKAIYHGGSNSSYNNTDIYALLNNYYYNAVSSNCRIGINNEKDICDFSFNGIKLRYKSFIKNVNWYLGGVTNDSTKIDDYNQNQNAKSIFLNERSGKYLGVNDSLTYSGNIGLLYASDYGFASVENICDRDTMFQYYNFKGKLCSSRNWILDNSKMLMNQIDTSGIFYLSTSGSIEYNNKSSSLSVYPTLYLNEKVYMIDGDGTITNPYIIGM